MKKPRVLVASDTRVPSGLNTMHGLGRSACEIAAGLHSRGYEVTLYGHPDSTPPEGIDLVPGDPRQEAVALIQALRDSPNRWDVVFDTGHQHTLSRGWLNEWRGAVVNRICDREIANLTLSAKAAIPNKVVNSFSMAEIFPGSKLVLTGIMREADLINIARRKQWFSSGDGYMLFMGEWHPHKNVNAALHIAKHAGIPLAFAYSMGSAAVDDMIAGASFLCHRSTIDAAPRSVIECALAGVPALVDDIDGAQTYVINGITGFVTKPNEDGLQEAMDMHSGFLDPLDVSAVAAEKFSYAKMIDGYVQLIERAVDGETW